MTQLTANDVSHHLLTISRELVALTRALNDKDVELAEKQERLKVAEAHAVVSAEGAADIRKAKAIIATAELRSEVAVLDAAVRGLIRDSRVLERRIDVGRSHGTNLRSELKTLGSQP